MKKHKKTMKEPEHFNWVDFFDGIVDVFDFIIFYFPQIIGTLILGLPLFVLITIFDSLDKWNERLKEEKLQNESGKKESKNDEELTKLQIEE